MYGSFYVLYANVRTTQAGCSVETIDRHTCSMLLSGCFLKSCVIAVLEVLDACVFLVPHNIIALAEGDELPVLLLWKKRARRHGGTEQRASSVCNRHAPTQRLRRNTRRDKSARGFAQLQRTWRVLPHNSVTRSPTKSSARGQSSASKYIEAILYTQ